MDEFSLSIPDYLAGVARRKRLIIAVTAFVTAAAIAVSFMLPKWYLATSTILPPKNRGVLSILGGGTSTLMRQLTPLRNIAASAAAPELYDYLAMLKSRTMMEKLVTEFDLIGVYGIGSGSVSEAVEELLVNLEFKVNEEGTLQIAVADHDALRASAMANYLVEQLEEMNHKLASMEASKNFIFIEQRVDHVKQDLAKAEDRLRVFQKHSGLPMMTEEMKAGASSMAELYVEKVRKELELAMLGRHLAADNEAILTIKAELAEMDKRIQAMPDLGLEYLRIYREYLIQQKILESLYPVMEQARIEQERDTPTLLVVDAANTPDRPYRPRKTLIVIVSFLSALFFSSVVALMLHRIDMLKTHDQEQHRKLLDALSLLVRWKSGT